MEISVENLETPAEAVSEQPEIQEEKWGPATEKLMSMLDIEVGTTRMFYKKINTFLFD